MFIVIFYVLVFVLIVFEKNPTFAMAFALIASIAGGLFVMAFFASMTKAKKMSSMAGLAGFALGYTWLFSMLKELADP